MGDRCTGHCCRKFPLSFPPCQIADNYGAWMRGEPKDHFGIDILTDIHLVAPAVRFTGESYTGDNGDRWLYSCIHLTDNRDCGIYDMRPAMCRDYPYGRKCQQEGCTWDYARQLPDKPNEQGDLKDDY
jgi:Fe-S-cluster containining protein